MDTLLVLLVVAEIAKQRGIQSIQSHAKKCFALVLDKSDDIFVTKQKLSIVYLHTVKFICYYERMYN